MTDYYCDLDEDTHADATGADHAGNEYTGPAGLQAAIRGTGNATALAAGDTLYVKGAGDLSRLVLLDCNGTDVSAWAPTNAVRNKDGAGDDWTGVVVQANDDPAGQLGADDLVLVWLASGKSEDDIDLADGIENTTLAESADPLAAKSTPGIQVDTNTGAVGSPITVVGRNASWVTDGTKAVLDGASKATNCLIDHGKHYWHVGNIEFKNATGDNLTAKTGNASYWVFKNCDSHHAGAGGWAKGGGQEFYHTSFVLCRSYTNGRYGFRGDYGCRFFFCTARGNGASIASYGFYSGYATYVGCLAYSNNQYNFYDKSTSSPATFFGCVSDDPPTAGIYLKGSAAVVMGCRLTGTGTGILGDGDADVLDLFNFINCTTKTNNITVDQKLRGADTRTESGVEGYVDGDNEDLSLRNYGLTRDAAARRIEVEL